MANKIYIVLPWFGVTRMARKAKKNILVEYNKKKLLFQLWTCDTSYKLIFYGEYNRDIYTLIWRHHDCPEGRERYPGWVEQEKTYVSIIDMWYMLKAYFLWGIRWRYFQLDLVSPGWPKTPRRTSWRSRAKETHFPIMDVWYML